MGAIVYLKQFLNKDGLHAYPALLERHRNWASQKQGFIALRSWNRIDPANLEAAPDLSEPELTVEFETLDDLMAWRVSEEHQQVAKDYAVYWTRDPELRFYEVSG